jgi:DNA-directed RNA polymerase subunit RPC12/RpoP
MEPSRSALKFEISSQTGIQSDSCDYICTRCGKPFTSPVFAVNNSPGMAEGYYACPSCLSKVEIRKEDKEIKEAKAPLPEPEVETIQQEKIEQELEPEPVEESKPSSSGSTPSVCQHYQGYLKNRPKGAPMPDECYTCALMLDCMH